jgi:predicted DsbA family dithiol-disulfide isomerase
VEVEWRAFLLRPRRSEPPRTLEEFRRYTESWRRPATEEPKAEFRVWQSEEGPPSHSVPPHLASKAAQRVDPGAWKRLHWLLLEAYFGDNRDITTDRVLLELWLEAGLPEARFVERLDESLGEEILRDHREAIEHGATGVPAVRLANGSGVVTGAHPVDAYRRWANQAAAAAG